MSEERRRRIVEALSTELGRQLGALDRRIDLGALADAVEAELKASEGYSTDEGKAPEELNASNDDGEG